MPPELSPLGERLRERTAPLAPDDAAYAWVHAHLCEAIMVMLREVGELFDPPDPIPPTAPLLDPALCPDWALPWMAQLVGVSVPPSATPEQARALITGAAGWKRGTPAALRATAEAFLTGDRQMWFRERDAGDAYRLEIVTRTAETPDPAGLAKALASQTPAGLVLSVRQVAGWDYQATTATGASYALLKTTYTSYTDLSEGP